MARDFDNITNLGKITRRIEPEQNATSLFAKRLKSIDIHAFVTLSEGARLARTTPPPPQQSEYFILKRRREHRGAPGESICQRTA
ncbi:hypothetical protein EVAR_100364_1 [Eumeta japonica]|uniref:Uncharacterized protein n=1 Tax=Eumeta variegata TaxID=151549 RepID=A0A4C2A8N7_EUMVA|nr:hypothetical protein EVAR_100364_1 [Eumeta japonica]